MAKKKFYPSVSRQIGLPRVVVRRIQAKHHVRLITRRWGRGRRVIKVVYLGPRQEPRPSKGTR